MPLKAMISQGSNWKVSLQFVCRDYKMFSNVSLCEEEINWVKSKIFDITLYLRSHLINSR